MVDAAKTACKACAAGRYEHVEEQACKGCKVGTWDAAGTAASFECTECPHGHKCPHTTPAILDYTVKVQCEAGKYQNEGKWSICKDCPKGWRQPSAGQRACETCPAGTYHDQTRQSGACKNCHWGTFADATGHASCAGCAAGAYTEETGQRTCKSCPKGWHQATTGKSNCKSCAVGSYADQTARTKCKNCDTGKYHRQTGRTSASACTFAPTPSPSAVPSSSPSATPREGKPQHEWILSRETSIRVRVHFPQSKLVSLKDGEQINAWIKQGDPNHKSDQVWQMCYKKADGKGSFDTEGNNFHDRCKDKGPTVTVVRVKGTTLKVIGGYAGVSWKGPTKWDIGYTASPTSFLFSLTNKFRHGVVAEPELESRISHYGKEGPIIGHGAQFWVTSDMNTLQCYHLGSTYSCRVGMSMWELASAVRDGTDEEGAALWAACFSDFCYDREGNIDDLEVWYHASKSVVTVAIDTGTGTGASGLGGGRVGAMLANGVSWLDGSSLGGVVLGSQLGQVLERDSGTYNKEGDKKLWFDGGGFLDVGPKGITLSGKMGLTLALWIRFHSQVDEETSIIKLSDQPVERCGPDNSPTHKCRENGNLIEFTSWPLKPSGARMTIINEGDPRCNGASTEDECEQMKNKLWAIADGLRCSWYSHYSRCIEGVASEWDLIRKQSTHVTRNNRWFATTGNVVTLKTHPYFCDNDARQNACRTLFCINNVD